MIVQVGMVYLFGLLFGCFNDSNIDKNPTQDIEEHPSPKLTKSIRLGGTPSPLNTEEVFPADFSDDLLQTINPSPLGFEETIAISNLLRGPCLEDWQKGRTLNQSLLARQCPKSVAWFKAVQGAVNKGISSEDILFTFVAPGPYIATEHVKFQNASTVLVTFEQSQLEMLRQRIYMLDAVSLHKVVLLIESNGEWLEFDRSCLLDGQKMTLKQAKDSCNWHTVQSEVFEVLERQKPLWIVNGYSVNGFRSGTQLQNMLDLP